MKKLAACVLFSALLYVIFSNVAKGEPDETLEESNNRTDVSSIKNDTTTTNTTDLSLDRLYGLGDACNVSDIAACSNIEHALCVNDQCICSDTTEFWYPHNETYCIKGQSKPTLMTRARSSTSATFSASPHYDGLNVTYSYSLYNLRNSTEDEKNESISVGVIQLMGLTPGGCYNLSASFQFLSFSTIYKSIAESIIFCTAPEPIANLNVTDVTTSTISVTATTGLGYVSEVLFSLYTDGELQIHNFTAYSEDGNFYFTFNESIESRTQYTIVSVAVVKFNSFELISDSLNISTYTVPSTPSLIATNTTSHTATVQWSGDPGIPMSDIVVDVPDQMTIKTIEQRSGYYLTSLSNLKPASQYYCQITVKTPDIDGLTVLKSETLNINITTNESLPGIARNISFHQVDSSSVMISWDKPIPENGVITTYHVNFSSHSVYGKVWSNNFLRSVSVRNVHLSVTRWKGHCFRVQVQAENSAGKGAYSDFNYIRLKSGVPESVSNLDFSATSESITITWQRPIKTYGQVSRYIVEHLNHTYEQDPNCPKVTPDKSNINSEKSTTSGCEEILEDCTESYTMTKTTLTPYTDYSFTVYACNLRHCGPKKSIHVRTEQDYPSAPVNLDGRAISSSSVELSWQPPKKPNGVLIGYTIEVNNGAITLTSEKTSAVVPNLHFWTSYNFTVRAGTKVGLGDRSITKVIRTKEEKSCQPENFSVSSTSSTTVQLTWSEPRCPNGIIKGYSLSYRKMNSSEPLIKVPLEATERGTDVKNLDIWTDYVFYLAASNSVGNGVAAYLQQKTAEGKSCQPENFSASSTSSTTVQLTWSEPRCPNGVIRGYSLSYRKMNSSEPFINIHLEATDRERRAINLDIWTDYEFYLSASNSVGNGAAAYLQQRTAEGKSCKPENFSVSSTSATTVELTWDKPLCPNGKIVGYTISYRKRKMSGPFKHFPVYPSYRNAKIENLDIWTDYEFNIAAYNSIGIGNTAYLHQRTAEGKPSVPYRATGQANSSTSITLSWETPTHTNGIIKGYRIKYHKSNAEGTPNIILVSDKTFIKSIGNLDIWTKYSFEIQAFNSLENGLTAILSLSTLEDAPVIPPTVSYVTSCQMQEVITTTSSINISIDASIFRDESRGRITQYGIIVAEQVYQDKSGMFTTNFTELSKQYGSWSDYQKTLKPYRATNEEWKPVKNMKVKAKQIYYVVGKEATCKTSYCNGKLKSNTAYKFRLFVCTRVGCGVSRYSCSFSTDAVSQGWVAGLVIALLLIICLIVLILLYLRRNKYGPWKVPQTNPAKRISDLSLKNIRKISNLNETDPRDGSVSLLQFRKHVEDMKKDSGLGFAQEYKEIKLQSSRHSTHASLLEVNRPKNRYSNVLAFDHSRVKLSSYQDEEGSDYINANYIPGFKYRREYIACQGPLSSTVDDFWRMIWEQKVSIVVMLTQIIENRKTRCNQYWPSETEESIYYGDLIVTMTSESVLCDYTIRVLEVQLGERSRTVKQYHYMKWPDFGCPENTTLLLSFCTVIRKDINPSRSGPIVVHCSAGVGRTGTFIAVDRLMQEVRELSSISVYDVVVEMRDYRNHMVQTEEQYIFVHYCVLEYYLEWKRESQEKHNIAFVGINDETAVDSNDKAFTSSL